MEVLMGNEITWKSLDVTAAEGMSLRVGAFKSSDGSVVEFSPEVLQKVFAKVTSPIPMYLTHQGARTGEQRTVLGHAVKLGLEHFGDKLHFMAVMMDPSFKLMYASGYDDTSAEITPILNAQGVPIDGDLTGIAVVPNPAIPGTEMTVRAMAFSAPSPAMIVSDGSQMSNCPKDEKKSSGGIKLTGRLDKTLLENGVPADKVESLSSYMESFYAKKFEQAGLQKNFEDQGKLLAASEARNADVQKKFEDVTKLYEAVLNDKVTTLAAECKALNFANPDAIVDGLNIPQKIATLSKLKETLVASKPALGGANFQVPPGTSPTGAPQKQFEDTLKELGLGDMWNTLHPGAS
jgi:hypothetical protein